MAGQTAADPSEESAQEIIYGQALFPPGVHRPDDHFCRKRLLCWSLTSGGVFSMSPEATDVAISVYDVSGRLVSRLSTGVETAGKHMVEWKTSGLPNGIYFLRLSAGRDAVTEKTVLVR